MRKLRSFVRYWLPVIVWMAVIFSFSSDSGSFHHSSRIIGPLVRWLFPHMAKETVEGIVYAVRKCAHFTEYAFLAWLFWRALRKPRRNDPRPWSWAEARQAMLLVALYAASDEWHQSFVPNREARVTDVALDFAGALVTMLCLWRLGRWRKLW